MSTLDASESGSRRKVSKTEVLILARKHIESLEKANQGLVEDKKVLLEYIRRLKGAWARMGGGVLP